MLANRARNKACIMIDSVLYLMFIASYAHKVATYSYNVSGYIKATIIIAIISMVQCKVE